MKDSPSENFLVEALVVLKQENQDMEDLLPFIMKHKHMIQSFTGASLPEDAIDGPMNSVTGFLTLIQLVYQTINRNCGVKPVETYKDESSGTPATEFGGDESIMSYKNEPAGTQGADVTLFGISVVVIEKDAISNIVLLRFKSKEDTEEAFKTFDAVLDLNGSSASLRRFFLLEACYRVISYDDPTILLSFPEEETFVPIAHKMKLAKYEERGESVIWRDDLVGGVVTCTVPF